MPRYQWLLDRLLNEIRAGRYQPGDLLPTEHALMAQYELSSTTVRRALRELEAQGVIYRRAGKGTFVRRAPLAEHLVRLTSFAEEMRQKNLQPAFKLLHAGPVAPPPEATQALGLPAGAQAYFIERLQLTGGQVIALAAGYWQMGLGQHLAAHDLDCCSLYDILENELNLRLGEADEIISAAAAESQTATRLGVPTGSPLLVRRRTTYAADQQPVEYTTTWYPADRYVYKVRLLRKQA